MLDLCRMTSQESMALRLSHLAYFFVKVFLLLLDYRAQIMILIQKLTACAQLFYYGYLIIIIIFSRLIIASRRFYWHDDITIFIDTNITRLRL